MIIEAFVLSLIVGFIRRGSMRNLENMPLRKSYLFVVGFVLAGAILALIFRGGDPTLIRCARLANILQYMILLAAIGLNLHVRGMLVVGIGTFLNFLVMTANGGMMPISGKALSEAGLTSIMKASAVRHLLFDPESHLPRLAFLSDIIPVRLFGYVCSQVMSIGDIIIAVGLFFMIQYYMCRPAPAKEPVPSG